MTSGIAEQVAMLTRLLDGTSIELLELTSGQETIRLRRDPDGAAHTALPPAEAAPGPVVPAPSVGVFRRTHPLRTEPIVRPGDQVQEGDPVGLLQIGALLLHVAAPCPGTVLEVLAQDGATVGFGTPLVRLSGG